VLCNNNQLYGYDLTGRDAVRSFTLKGLQGRLRLSTVYLMRMQTPFVYYTSDDGVFACRLPREFC